MRYFLVFLCALFMVTAVEAAPRKKHRATHKVHHSRTIKVKHASSDIISDFFTGVASLFGQYDGKYRWRDRHDNGRNASGLPQSTPGIALRNRKTLGHYYTLKAPNGQSLVVRHVDMGPAKWTGKSIDVNAAAAERLGYSPKNFPTGSRFTVAYMGRAPS